LGGSQVGGKVLGRISSMLTRGKRSAFIFFKGVAAFFFGAGFAAAWSPCIGAVLGSVLSLTLAHPEQGLALFTAYMLGFGIPLLVLGFFAEELGHLIEKVNTQTVHVQSIFGSVLVVIGMFMVLFPPEQVLKCF
jgi:cytochrome c biogenesis protein CcdA